MGGQGPQIYVWGGHGSFGPLRDAYLHGSLTALAESLAGTSLALNLRRTSTAYI